MIAIGIDIGGTFVKFFAVNSKGKVLKEDRVPTYTTLRANSFLKQLSDIVNNWKKIFKGEKIVIGVGIAGDTDDTKGVLRFAPNIPWRNLKVTETLTKLTGCKCFTSNDANMAAWGVYQKEFKAKYKNLVMITLGTGIGGGLIIDGKLYQGATGSAGEFGHIKIDYSPDAPICGCGNRGCLEAFIGTKGLKRMAQMASVDYPTSPLAKLVKTEKFSVKLLSIAAEQGDPVALNIWKLFGTYLARGAVGLVLTLNPSAVVLAGGVSRGAKYFMPYMEEVFAAQSIKTPFKKLKILLSKEGDIGGIGAALYALEKVNEK